tara:strand:- start:1373 stop:2047 length:675 start_codon:yes stop_codon:yes gene_type:complete
MKKLIYSTVLLFVAALGNHLNAQETEVSSFNTGDNLLNIGISPFTYAYGSAYYSYTNYSAGMTMPPVTVNLQHGFNDFVSAGLTYGRFGRYYKWENPIYGTSYIEKYKSTYTYSLFGVVGEFHYAKLLDEIGFTDGISEKADLYVGVIIGALQSKWKDKNQEYIYNYTTSQYELRVMESSSSSSGGIFRSYAGGRYYFSPNFGGFIEMGYSGFGYLTLGLTFKM